jgi:ferredoxin
MGQVILNGHPPAPLVPGEKTVLDQMLDAGLPALYLCMAGGCGRCKVRVEAGSELLGERTRPEAIHRCDADHRLACQARVVGDGTLRLKQ